QALRNTAIWIVGVVAPQIVFGMLVALVLNQEFKARGFIRGLILVPWVTPSILTALMWAWMYNGNYGVINDILFRVGVIGQYVPWLAQSQTALPAIIATLWWQGTPFFAVMLLAGLQSIPAELY